MGFVHGSHLFFLLFHLPFLLVSCSDHGLLPHFPFPPTEAPTQHHHHAQPPHHHHIHHHHHAYPPHPHGHPPPTHPQVKPPAKPPTPHPHEKSPTKQPALPPAHPPVKPPAHPSLKPPIPPFAHPPYHPSPRKHVAVQGVVYCKSCNYTGIDTLIAAAPLAGAEVVLKCKNTRWTLKQKATTDRNGYFLLRAPETISSYGAHKCRVYLGIPPPHSPCKRPTNLHGGVFGGFLTPEKLAPQPLPLPLPFALYTVGPFAYEPPKCPRH
ncbi:hypothetical protein Nepgr_007289 [Nepenthes gracilis]|uniref:Uncharacterized protein n=1 Tax=Nepenthes gracilis TaxID=150966 RepID=A0AAD3S6U9_NEPGR|nr:hypothetical protein Nepgr_007289 [Nepenthes gracilis]